MPDNLYNAPADLSTLAEYTGGDQEAIKELIEVFYETADEALEGLKANITSGENKVWSLIAHTLKGASSYVGAKDLQKLCEHAQNMDVASAEERAVLFDQINVAYDIVKGFLKQKVGV